MRHCVLRRLTPPFVFLLFGTSCLRQRSVGLEGAGGAVGFEPVAEKRGVILTPCFSASLTVVYPKTNARGMVALLGVPVVCLSREVPPEPPPKRSFPEAEGSGKRNVFRSDSFRSPTVVLHDPFSTTPYSLLTVCFPFGITVVAFGSPMAPLSQESRHLCDGRSPGRCDPPH